MNNRLKVICILFAIAYLFVIGNYVATHVTVDLNFEYTPEKSKDGVPEPSKSQPTNEGQDYGLNGSAVVDYTSDFCVKPLHESNSLIPLLNKKTGDSIYVKSDKMSTKVPIPENSPRWVHSAESINLILHLCTFFIIIYIPFVAFRTVKSISREEIFEPKNIKRIRRIGYLLLICFISTVASTYISTLSAQRLIDLENYQIIFRLDGSDNAFLLIGLILLLFAEILKISTSIKEENDLTV